MSKGYSSSICIFLFVVIFIRATVFANSGKENEGGLYIRDTIDIYNLDSLYNKRLIIDEQIYEKSIHEPIIINDNYIKRTGLCARVYSVPDGVIRICHGALVDECRIDTLFIPEGVKEIEDKSLRVMEAVSLPKSLLFMSADAFFESGLKGLKIPQGVCSISFSNETSESTRPKWEYISVDIDNLFYDSRNNCNAVICSSTGTLIMGCKNTIVPDGVKEIGRMSFSFCQELSNVVLPNSVNIISDSAFYRCYDLTKIHLPENVNVISDGAFAHCWNLSLIRLPNHLRIIGRGALSGCSVVKLYIPQNVTFVGEMAFAGCSKLKKIVVNKRNSNYKSVHKKSIVEIKTGSLIAMIGKRVPPEVVSISPGASMRNEKIRKLNIPNGVVSVGKESFLSCSNLNELIIPETVSEIDDYAFALCYNLKDVYNLSTIPQNIDEKVFTVYGTLHVKKGYRDSYLKAKNWNKFYIIDDIDR
jgi:hypothetical protein